MAIDPKDVSDVKDVESAEDEEENLTLDKNFQNQSSGLSIKAALQDRIAVPAIEMQSLPAPIKRKVKALKQLQLQTTNMEAKFYEEIHALECKYYKICEKFYEKRKEITTGHYEPTDEECVWETDEEEESLTNDMKTKIKIEQLSEEKEKVDNENEDIKGIPEFWLTIFKNVGMLAEMVQEHDEPILKHLNDIKVKFLESDPIGFVLEFHFDPNEFFANTVLTKEYIMTFVPDKNDPFSFEGPEIYKSKGCTIDWKKGKNITVKTIKKSQKHKSRGFMRTITKTVQNDSFFNFFSPPVVADDTEAELDDDIQALITSDFEIGHYIRERIVPRAVLFYTGEGLEDEEDDYDDEEGEDGDEEEEEEDKEECSIVRAPKDLPADCKSQ